MTTSLGNFVLELDPVAAPATVRNFLGYVNAGFYRNVIFHRVIADTLVQSGGYTPARWSSHRRHRPSSSNPTTG